MGVVTDERTGEPVAGATVTGNGYADVTELDGSYALENLPPKTYMSKVTKSGYVEASASWDVIAGEVVTLNIAISSTPIPPIDDRSIGNFSVWPSTYGKHRTLTVNNATSHS